MKTYADRHDDGRRKRRRSSSLNRFQDELGSLDEDQLQFMVDAPNDYVNDIFNQFDLEQGTASRSAHLITEDESAEAEGLIGKSAFLELAEQSVRSKLQESFEGTGFTEKDCPWLKHLFRHYGRRSAKYLEHSIHKYLPGTKQAESAEEYIAPLGEKVQRAIAAWLKTGQITEVPNEIPRSLMRVAGQDAANQRARMGKGKQLDSSTKSKMEGAFGASLGDVKVHTENEGSAFAEELDAQAATIGKDIAFGAGKYKPGTPEGDALIAHELAHVMQQQGATETGEMGSGADYSAIEQDAEGATRGVMGRLWGGMRSSFADLKANAWPRLKSGLQMQRCDTTEETSEDPFQAALDAGETAFENTEYKLAVEKFTEAFGLATSEEDKQTAQAGIDKSQAALDEQLAGKKYFTDVTGFVKKVTITSSANVIVYDGVPVFDSIDTDYARFVDLKSGTYSVVAVTDKGEEKSSFIHSGGAATVYFKTDLSGDKDKDYKAATNFQELIDLIRAAEVKLKADGQDVNTRVQTIRGIFYGTEWSMDYSHEKSTMRNTGFQYFLYGYSGAAFDPMNPQSILGDKLFQAIFNSFEVTNTDGRVIDVGHLFIGMEARQQQEGREEERTDPNPMNATHGQLMGGSGLELTTWLGDLGGGTGQLAKARVTKPDKPALSVFEDEHSYGAPINLEGDIDAFVIAGDKNQGTGMPLIFLNEEKGITGALIEYLDPDLSEQWKNRAKIFLTIYGGTFDANNDLTNKDALVELFAGKITKMGFFYTWTRMKDEANAKKKESQLSDAQNKAIDDEVAKFKDTLLPEAAEEVASLFVDALVKTVKDPNRTITP